MENKNYQSPNKSILGDFNIKSIVLLLIIIFVLSVAYKLIPSRDDRQELADREQLEQCLNNAEVVMERGIALVRDLVMETRDPDFKSKCESFNMQYSDRKDNCSPVPLDEGNTLMQEERDKAEIEKQECYRMYK